MGAAALVMSTTCIGAPSSGHPTLLLDRLLGVPMDMLLHVWQTIVMITLCLKRFFYAVLAPFLFKLFFMYFLKW
jgi:hypothetical protein